MNQELMWFDEGAGGVITAAGLSLAIQLIGCALAISYLAWVCIASYNEWGKEEISGGDMLITWFRSVAVLMVLLYLFTT
tara:strand:+ start:37336 stop:37572 length:237 start_codon:yes stop_codon:yes gene_type:complete